MKTICAVILDHRDDKVPHRPGIGRGFHHHALQAVVRVIELYHIERIAFRAADYHIQPLDPAGQF